MSSGKICPSSFFFWFCFLFYCPCAVILSFPTSPLLLCSIFHQKMLKILLRKLFLVFFTEDIQNATPVFGWSGISEGYGIGLWEQKLQMGPLNWNPPHYYTGKTIDRRYEQLSKKQNKREKRVNISFLNISKVEFLYLEAGFDSHLPLFLPPSPVFFPHLASFLPPPPFHVPTSHMYVRPAKKRFLLTVHTTCSSTAVSTTTYWIQELFLVLPQKKQQKIAVSV